MSKECIENYIKILKDLEGKESYYERVYFQEEIERLVLVSQTFILEFLQKNIRIWRPLRTRF
jgi:hypothetical protein